MLDISREQVEALQQVAEDGSHGYAGYHLIPALCDSWLALSTEVERLRKQVNASGLGDTKVRTLDAYKENSTDDGLCHAYAGNEWVGPAGHPGCLQPKGHAGVHGNQEACSECDNHQ